MNPMDIVTIGETMVLMSPQKSGPLRYVPGFHKQMGGAESNVAIGATRLGCSVGWISQVGDDEFGRYITQNIRSEGVDVSQVVSTGKAPTGVFFKEKKNAKQTRVYYYRANSAASQMSTEQLPYEYLKNARLLHLTGITPALSESCKQMMFDLITWAKAEGILVSFDPNVRLTLWSKEEAAQVLHDLAIQADILLPGIPEGELMCGESDPVKIASYFRQKGVDNVIVKLGPEGAYYDCEGEQAQVSGFKVDTVVDSIGAGDAFAAAVLSSHLQGFRWDEAVKRGNAAGALVVMTEGDYEGLPDTEELDAFMAQKIEDDVLR
ncbi:sugar kinase [Aureibacillus halotolerans]|uniref:5-dehydro-2-deoxygluconokinase n=1 Tax=Aureibacillus halotolerans TaxID=1508390 RepID=A0A4R6UAU9_9BACI|nr:sugar kinase [Aureibacillus halotolerans]TDQ42183.1 5-dehydro-2-deoxygluconokinase [Aureibacillus halotolerans]